MKRKFNLLLPALLFASAALNLFQMQQLRAKADPNPGPAIGSPAAPVTVSTLEGYRVDLHIGKGQRTLLYVFSPRCGWCIRNRANMLALESQLRDRVRVAAISLSEHGLNSHLAQYPVPFTVYKSPAAETIFGYGMAGTPQTILISADGKIERIWSGAFAERTKSEIESTLGVQLPGLTAD